ncbi:indolepyruvate oxidoreductase [Bacteroidia bacterium]|jgi:indolepyruvate ferredoxin oxidoreductase beta subunit|nr:indolepyruvate oxidoreductase subunit beta [Prevotellaceae bacterium]GHT32296.1 indolepyruvate oxidoreductase [Bacteroidia bacterium]GHT57521.1 indolepyruvate oxidoreductase [Bacteroidia bacterium]
MKTDIILAGVGGQGILSIATVIAASAMKNGLYLKQSEVHGMSQRGGDVQSHLRISDEPIASDLIPLGKADLILSLEPMEALRYLPWLKPEGSIVSSNIPFKNIPDYPEEEAILAEIRKIKSHVLIDADKIAKEQVGSVRSANMVLLGAATPFLGLDFEKIEDGIRAVFGRKGEEIVETNIKALRAGKEYK